MSLPPSQVPKSIGDSDEKTFASAFIQSPANNRPKTMLSPPSPFITQSANNHLKTTLPPPAPVGLKRKALLIGIQHYAVENAQSDSELDPAVSDGQLLKGPHADVRAMRQLLLDCYGYNPNDITVIIDDGDSEHVQPTEKKLIQCMKELVADARSGDHFYLHFSGHGTQVPDINGDEEDERDECIITCDHELILDDTLKEILVDGLPVGSTFVSTFDSCHSGTVLDLKHYRCNRVYVPWVNKGFRRTMFLQNIVTRKETQISDILASGSSSTIQIPTIQVSEENPAGRESLISPDSGLLVLRAAPIALRPVLHPALFVTTELSAENQVDDSADPIQYVMSPYPVFCTGRCREEPVRDFEVKADVVSLSATKDYQLAWENAHGSSMTEALIKVLREDPHTSLKDIMTLISHDLHRFYKDLHDHSRSYKDAVKKTNIKRQSRGRKLAKRTTVEMDNFQNPQISSHRPLDMNRPWPL